MQEMPKDIFEWTEIDWSTGKRKLKANAPDDIKNKALQFENEFYNKTGRRRIDNIDIATA